jgi:hypothetical protein
VPSCPEHVRGLGRGRGTVSRYPPGSTARLVRVAQIHAGEHRLSYTAWRLWWDDGGEMPPPARELLTQLADRLDTERDRLAGLLAGEDAGDPAAVAAIDEFYEHAENARFTGVLGQARRNIGRERFASVLRVLAEVGAGRFTGYSEATPGGDGAEVGTEALVERALELDRARTDRLAGGSPWLPESSEGSFVELSRVFASRSVRAAASAPSTDLDQARLELQSLMAVIGTVAPLFERLFGRAAFGFGLIARTLADPTPRSQAFMLLGWIVLREDEAFREGLQRIAGAEPAASATVKLYDVLAQLRRDVPALAPLLTDERLAAAQRDADAAEALNADIARVRAQNTSELDVFFSTHPESDELIALVDRPENSASD